LAGFQDAQDVVVIQGYFAKIATISWRACAVSDSVASVTKNRFEKPDN
jgi:dolichol kinase